MTAHSPIHAREEEAHPIHVRDRRFDREHPHDISADPVGAAWFTALSASFPRGEAMFIQAVKAFRQGVPEQLDREIGAFIRQEVNHSREHLAFNRSAEAGGFDLAEIDRRIIALVDETQSKSPLIQLTVTMALEHFTAMFAHEFLTKPDRIATDGMGERELWLWHAAEEIEHKAVAFDTWRHATRHLAPRKRWLLRCLVMLRTTARFTRNRWRDATDLLAQKGITGWRARWALFRHLWIRPGILRRILPAWLAFFRPGFHPWDIDDRALIHLYDSEYAAANLTSGSGD